MAEAVTVSFNPAALLSFQVAALALSDDRLHQALQEALSAAGGKTRTQVRRALREQTNVKAAKDINDRTHSAGPGVLGKLEYRIEGLNKVLKLDRVKGLTVKTGPGGGVSAAPWQVMRQFQRSFVIMKDGAPRYVARLPEKGGMRTLFGPSVAKELTKDQSRETFETYAAAELEAQVVKKLERFLPR